MNKYEFEQKISELEKEISELKKELKKDEKKSFKDYQKTDDRKLSYTELCKKYCAAYIAYG